MAKLRTIIDSIKQEELTDAAKWRLLQFHVNFCCEIVSKHIINIIDQLKNESLKEFFSNQIAINLKIHNVPDYWFKSPKEYLDHYNEQFKGTKTLDARIRKSMQDDENFFDPTEGCFNRIEDNMPNNTLWDLIQLSGLAATGLPDTRRSCNVKTRDNIKKIVHLFCNEYKIQIPDYRTQTYKEAQKQSALAKKQTKNSWTV